MSEHHQSPASDTNTPPGAAPARRERACAGLKDSGEVCGNIMTRQDADGTWKCRHHRALGPGRVRPPMTRLKNLEDEIGRAHV